MPPVAVHFNGGVNLPDTETVLRSSSTASRAVCVGCPTASRASAPDGSATRYPASSPRPDWSGSTRRAGDGPYGRNAAVRLPAGTDADEIEWPDLGYAVGYARSYATFRRLRDEGVVPPGVRFQVEYPTPRRGRGPGPSRTAATGSSARTGAP